MSHVSLCLCAAGAEASSSYENLYEIIAQEQFVPYSNVRLSKRRSEQAYSGLPGRGASPGPLQGRVGHARDRSTPSPYAELPELELASSATARPTSGPSPHTALVSDLLRPLKGGRAPAAGAAGAARAPDGRPLLADEPQYISEPDEEEDLNGRAGQQRAGPARTDSRGARNGPADGRRVDDRRGLRPDGQLASSETSDLSDSFDENEIAALLQVNSHSVIIHSFIDSVTTHTHYLFEFIKVKHFDSRRFSFKYSRWSVSP